MTPFSRRPSALLALAPFTFASVALAFAADPPPDSGRPVGSRADTGLYEQSIKSTKRSLNKELIDELYQDALESYRERRFDDALQMLDHINRIDPHHEEAAKLRESIRKSQTSKQTETVQIAARDLIRQGDKAAKSGQTIIAINYWKQALAQDPTSTAAKKKIQEANQSLAKHQFEAGYIHYRHGDLEDALDAWSNAVALDPSYKRRGLMLLMSKVDLKVRTDQVSRLAAQGFEQMQAGDMASALQSYQQVLKMDPRHDEARRMTGKIQIRLGQIAYRAAEQSLSRRDYAEAASQAGKAMEYGFEAVRAEKIKKTAEAKSKEKVAVASRPKTDKPKQTEKPKAAEPPPDKPEPPAEPAKPRDPEGALAHYRKGLAAIRTKDYRLANQELEAAAQLDPTNEHIYMARERARQEWAAMSGAGGQ
jgi:tetratricopeptide (TPR) repeat protein